MRIIKKVLKVLGITLGFFALLLIAFIIYVYNVSDYDPPKVTENGDTLAIKRVHIDGSLYSIEDSSWIRKNRYDLYEMKVSDANPFKRGLKNGILSREQIVAQEVAFTDQIKQMIPSDKYLKFLKYIVGFMNKDLPDHVKEEYKEEIFGVSYAAADSFNWIGDNYDRILNYHAAHDIGHALQNMMLVGCTSFGAWDSKTYDSSLLIGRNFDFWVGDKFAEEKIVAFYNPGEGYKFAFVTWGGFTGVVSGMNEEGLTVTINAAKSDIPFSAATPVSLVAREVLQYASNIEEAIEISKSREMFVSESFLIGSAQDHKAIVIEKTPDELHIYDPSTDNIRCANHYQSEGFESQKLNVEQKSRSASVYRDERLEELMNEEYPLTPNKVATILRDRKGTDGADIGNGNEKAINQLIAHHSVIFQPDSLRMWVSTSSWQLGEYICYDLNKIFTSQTLKEDVPIIEENLTVKADSFLYTSNYTDFLNFRKNKLALLSGNSIDTFETVHSNPNYYDAYRIAGDYCKNKGWYKAAIDYYNSALGLEIATVDEREAIEEKILLCKKNLKE